jgi:PLP dependent protein
VTREEQIRNNLGAVRGGIARACERAGRDPDEITMVAVSKFMTDADIAAAVAAGQVDFGENYAQELLQKAASPLLAGASVLWHFQGGLQSRKVRDILPVVASIQSVDRGSVIDELAKRATTDRPIDAYLEINTGNEDQKSGAEPSEAESLCRRLMDIPGIRLRGLMCIPPFADDPEASRPYFRMLRRLRDDLRHRLGPDEGVLSGLSMGMTADYAVAIEEGATVVRIGTAIFGARQYQQ